jgi:hypothetical protein
MYTLRARTDIPTEGPVCRLNDGKGSHEGEPCKDNPLVLRSGGTQASHPNDGMRQHSSQWPNMVDFVHAE